MPPPNEQSKRTQVRARWHILAIPKSLFPRAAQELMRLMMTAGVTFGLLSLFLGGSGKGQDNSRATRAKSTNIEVQANEATQKSTMASLPDSAPTRPDGSSLTKKPRGKKQTAKSASQARAMAVTPPEESDHPAQSESTQVETVSEQFLRFEEAAQAADSTALTELTTAPANISSDDALRAEIEVRLARAVIGKDGFRLQVRNGIAYWDGHTDVAQHKGAATRMARSAGALQVVNRILVGSNTANAATAVARTQEFEPGIPLRRAVVEWRPTPTYR